MAQTFDPDHTFFGNRVPGIREQLAEAGVTRQNATRNTYVELPPPRL